MRILTVAAGAFVLSASTAFAWQSNHGVVTGFQPNNPNSSTLVYAYPTANYCPAGLAPVQIGGVVCCGVPTAYPEPVHRPHKPQATYVSYGKGLDEGAYVATGKGYGDGYKN
ncbi:hypothetical protein [Anianabacter salinae]|uniref:hypothetical protein n=1 Tax=Anianabacter salinae TaxID=2851023 RepID=UPI00225E2EE7|nr:hypothetical protein [Anianabacter salinae]MBV0912561.1 hypothetical protein [Anianabacter salinae]